ncbi:DUF697 domain-containing protein [bacterium]|nr:DUF697 domain-containing protein [bacterium]
MKIIKRLLFFLSMLLIYVIFRELLELYFLTRSVHPIFGYISLGLIFAFVTYFILIPIYKIVRIPKNYAPTTDPDKVPEIIRHRLHNFQQNPFLTESQIDLLKVSQDEAGYHQIIEHLQKEAEQLRRRYVLQLFYSSSISQNGFLDAILILSSSINLIKDLFILYHGRVSNKDLWAIAKKVYLSMAIGGSEGVEYATQELFSKFATEGFKSVPFADKIFGSLADGFVNAALLTRISLITENYCTMVRIESERDLFPSSEFIMRTTKFITSDIFEKMTIELLRMSKEKTVDYVMFAVNPVAHVFGRTIGKVKEGTNKFTSYQKEMLKDVVTIAHKPVGYGLDRLSSIFKKRRSSDWELNKVWDLSE